MPPPEWLAKLELKLKVDTEEMVFEATFDVDGVTIHRTGIDDFEIPLSELKRHHSLLGQFIDQCDQNFKVLKG